MPRRHLAGAVAVAVLAAGAVVLWPRKPNREPPPVLATVPDFTMTDAAGRPFASASELRGRVWAATFLFTRCPTVCPLLAARVKKVQDATTKLGDRFRLVSFSVDPDHDTPTVLAAFARTHGADPARWSFVTGDPAPIAAAMKIGLDRVPDAPPGEAIVHGTHIVLLDGEMQIRGYYDSSDDAALERLLADARLLTDEKDPHRRDR
jgi:protein SCO1